MDKQELFEYAHHFFSTCQDTLHKKNADYTNGQDDTFGNFKAVETLGISTEVGFLTRMMDKMKRIASFTEKGELQVKDESVQDTLMDLANYACLLSAYIESKKPNYPIEVGIGPSNIIPTNTDTGQSTLQVKGSSSYPNFFPKYRIDGQLVSAESMAKP